MKVLTLDCAVESKKRETVLQAMDTIGNAASTFVIVLVREV